MQRFFRELHDLLHDQFRCSKILNVPRSCNSSVHELARIGMSWDPDQSCVWTDPIPDFVISMVAHDSVEHESLNIRP